MHTVRPAPAQQDGRRRQRTAVDADRGDAAGHATAAVRERSRGRLIRAAISVAWHLLTSAVATIIEQVLIDARTVSANGIRQRVFVGGPDDGAPVLFIHGNCSSAEFWRPLWRRLSGE